MCHFNCKKRPLSQGRIFLAKLRARAMVQKLQLERLEIRQLERQLDEVRTLLLASQAHLGQVGQVADALAQARATLAAAIEQAR